ncbi:MAG: DEAD/DEAH box helicase [Micavibrio aeruginosavorus]|nr:DEAD/DEAH box helicase [Micavibrio aeruginosavorus]
MNFEDLGLGPEIVQAVTERGYVTPTPIQEQAIPHILMMRDVLGLAQTGTGKTAGFTLPMIEILSGGRARARMPRSLILSPTRELAAQIAENFDVYGKYHKLSKALLVGGESMGDQIKLLERGVDVLIATPGRLLDLFDRGNILLSDIKILVIDEADRMLDMGFIPDIEKIVSKVPPQRQTLLFSATMPPEIKRLADKFLSNPRTVSVAAAASPAETVTQSLVWVREREKREALDALIQAEDVKNAFIFCNRKTEVDALAKWLSNRNYAAAPMHGDMVQTLRTKTLLDFKEGEVTLLVCSDVAARGLDVSKVSHVFNYDVPMHPDDYVHRIGRTGRAGQSGRSWMLATPDDDKYVNAIESLIKKAIQVEKIEGFEAPPPGEKSTEGRGERGGRRESGGGRGRGDRDRGGRNRGGEGHRGNDRPRGGESRGNERRPERHDDRPRRDPQQQPQPVIDRAERPERTERPPQRSDRNERFTPRRDSQSRPEQRQSRPRPREDDDSGPSGFGDDLPGFLKR